jgi:hypothetical protein
MGAAAAAPAVVAAEAVPLQQPLQQLGQVVSQVAVTTTAASAGGIASGKWQGRQGAAKGSRASRASGSSLGGEEGDLYHKDSSRLRFSGFPPGQGKPTRMPMAWFVALARSTATSTTAIRGFEPHDSRTKFSTRVQGTKLEYRYSSATIVLCCTGHEGTFSQNSTMELFQTTTNVYI